MTDDIKTSHIQSMYEDYFLEYASYVITDRAVPYVDDGLKPVQRRILHALREMEDGRFHKVANAIGQTMKFHPHGDAAIGDALVGLGQKNLLLDTQGNWGDPVTGDSAAAARYIETRLSKFALEVAFNSDTTVWQRSYDGRNREPVMLPMKFPLLLAQGAEGIAVGLSTRVLPHNFQDLIRSCISILRGERFTLFPDFPTGGIADCSNYNEGRQGGRVKVRGKITALDNRTLVISEIPYGVTTGNLIESIITANDKGKLKIKNIEDRTAENVEIVVRLPIGSDADKTIDALYAFTDCESSIATNCCVIRDGKPAFVGVVELLEMNVEDTVHLLKLELEIKQRDLEEKWHFRTLEQIFIEERIYRRIEKCETWEAIIDTIRKGLDPFKDRFVREVTDEDITKLTEIRIKRISRFDSDRAKEELIALEKEIAATKRHLRRLVDYAIAYYEDLLRKYGKGRERKTQITHFTAISAADVILSNLKVYIDREGGFVGTNLKNAEFLTEASALDEIVTFKEDGTLVVTKVGDKTYVGKKVLFAEKFNREATGSTVYNLLYRDGRGGHVMVKRFTIGGVTRDKQYDLTRGKDGSKILYLSRQDKGKAEKVEVHLVPKPRVRSPISCDFSEFEVRGRGSAGNIFTKHTVRRIGKSTTVEAASGGVAGATRPVKIFYNQRRKAVGSGVDGSLVCKLAPDENLLIVFQDGEARCLKPGGEEKLEKVPAYLAPWKDEAALVLLYVNGDDFSIYGKRVKLMLAAGKSTRVIPPHEDSKVEYATMSATPSLELEYKQLKGQPKSENVQMSERRFPEMPGNAEGTRISTRGLKGVKPAKTDKGLVELQTSLF